MRTRKPLAQMDWWMILAVVLLMAVGVLFIYSASYHGGSQRVLPYYGKQIVWDLLGWACFVGLALTDYRKIIRTAWVWYGLAVLLLVLTLTIGRPIRGAHRWLEVMGIYIQPAEIAKVAVVAVLASFLGAASRPKDCWRTVLGALLIVAVPFVLIFKQPDLGTAVVLAPTLLMLLYVAGVPLRILAFVCLLGILVAPLGWLALDDYQKNRIIFFLDPSRDPLGAGWNKIQSEIAVGSGGFWGKGYLKGTQNILGFLPRTVAPTDFIFSVIAEEAGFVGSVSVIGLITLMLFRCLRIALAARVPSGKLFAVGVASILFVHAFVNIAMSIGLCPITGLPLPLVSYGGSVTVMTMVSLGIVQSVRLHG